MRQDACSTIRGFNRVRQERRSPADFILGDVAHSSTVTLGREQYCDFLFDEQEVVPSRDTLCSPHLLVRHLFASCTVH